MSSPIALAGIGKIARDQHVPAIAAGDDWHLAATISRHGTVDGVEAHSQIDVFLSARPDIATVSLALPPVPRFAAAMACLRAGRHVMLEKPPGATLAEVHALRDEAEARDLTLYATWHSRMAPAVAAARDWLQGRAVTATRVTWHEDVRRWHPGQDWIWQAGGMGVLDPGINALSILTALRPGLHLTGGVMEVPEGAQTPIAARLTLSGETTVDLDWRVTGPQTWRIEIDTDAGPLVLEDGGARATADGAPLPAEGPGEYPALYARMADLVACGTSDVDLSPMVLVADAFTLAERRTVAPFAW
ncbi:MAG: Gfo/Idh/MocA family protein [Paracoccaceae bacterium]